MYTKLFIYLLLFFALLEEQNCSCSNSYQGYLFELTASIDLNQS